MAKEKEKIAVEAEGVSGTLEEEIDASVEQVVTEAEKEREAAAAVEEEPEESSSVERAPAEEPVVEEAPEGEPSEEGSPEEGSPAETPPAITDEHVERAVRNGLSIKEARSFSDVDVFEKVMTRLEAQTSSGSDDDSGADGKPGDESSVDKLLEGIPDLDPEHYDENVVAGMKGVKEMLRKQDAVIRELREGSQTQRQGWLDGQVENLGESFQKAMKSDPSRKDAVKKKFDVLEAGYKAAGQSVDRAEVFKEALAMVMPEESVGAKKEAVSGALSKRRAQHVARSAGGGAKKATDHFEDVAREIEEKFDL